MSIAIDLRKNVNLLVELKIVTEMSKIQCSPLEGGTLIATLPTYTPHHSSIIFYRYCTYTLTLIHPISTGSVLINVDCAQLSNILKSKA